MAREKNIPIEVNPISNQVLGLVKDLRNHPVAPLIQEGFPMVISSDDPGLWDAKGLSYDFYLIFMAMAGKNMNLKLLKKLVNNSLEFSTLKGEELEQCRAIFQFKWDKYIQHFEPEKYPSGIMAANSSSNRSAFSIIFAAVLTLGSLIYSINM